MNRRKLLIAGVAAMGAGAASLTWYAARSGVFASGDVVLAA